MNDWLFILAFYGFAGLMVFSALTMLLSRNILYVALGLLFSFLSLAALYVLNHADFVAVAQIVIYIGGVLVLLLFGIMLTYRPKIPGTPEAEKAETGPMAGFRNLGLGLGIAVLAGLALVYLILEADFAQMTWIQEAANPGKPQATNTTAGLGVVLVADYLLVFELAAWLLLVALVGSVLLASRPSE
ncbi:MAG: NADH-ubiquinone/plastoquinone oxidoreductase chain 6 [Microscillaceae bacterium]|nr:NADH-ubiquinone/plastoquinone oxidoreductase chain 6 [Microscillaceae bacterium]